jgi:sphingomyelin phosphodiesterase 2
MKILSFNAALLDFRLLGRSILRPTDYLSERLSFLPKAIMDIGADVVCLQEVYSPRHKEIVRRGLLDLYPYCFYHELHPIIGFDSGLMIASKHQLTDLHWERLVAQPFEESLLSKKCLLFARFVLDGISYCITLTHTTASGSAFKQDNKRVEAIRAKQIAQAVRCSLSRSRATNKAVAILCGDFNCGPQVSTGNYEAVLRAGFVDTYSASNSNELPTWDPENVLNQRSQIFKHSPKQRIDFIFLEKQALPVFSSISSKIIFTERIVPVNGDTVPLSDHYGVISELTR